MRRLLWPLCTPARRLALVAAAAFLLLACYAPYRPRYSAPTRAHFPVGFSPDGRQFALHDNYLASDRLDEVPNVLYGKVFLHDLTAAGVPERTVTANLFEYRLSYPPRPAPWLFWEYVRNPSIHRRLLAQVVGDQALDPGQIERPPLDIVDASPDRKYWAYRTVDRQPIVGQRIDDEAAVRLVVREVATGRVVLTTAAGFCGAAFGPGPDALTTVHSERSPESWTERVERWDLATGRRVTPDDWPRFLNASASVSAGGRHVAVWSKPHNSPECRLYDTADGFRLVRSFVVPADLTDNLGWSGRHRPACVATGGGRGQPAWLRVWTLDREEPIVLLDPLGHTLWPQCVAPDGSLAAIGAEPDVGDQGPWDWLEEWANRVGVSLRPRSKLWLFDTATGRVTAELGAYKSSPHAVFSDDGRQLAAVGDGVLHVYDVPLRRPWLLIAAWAAVATLAFAALDFGVRRLRRRRAIAAPAN